MAAMVHPEAHEQPSGKVLTFADPDAAPGNYPETQMDRVQMTLLIMSWIQLLLGCTLPVLDIAIELKDESMSVWAPAITVGAATVLSGIFGVVAGTSGVTACYLLHITVTVLLCTASTGFAAAYYYVIALRCDLVQSAFVGCSGLACASGDGSCSADDIDTASSTCEAIDAGVCSYYRDDRGIYTALIPVGVLLGALVPLACSLALVVQQATGQGAGMWATRTGRVARTARPSRRSEMSVPPTAAARGASAKAAKAANEHASHQPARAYSKDVKQAWPEGRGAEGVTPSDGVADGTQGYEEQGYDAAGAAQGYEGGEYEGGYYDENGNWVEGAAGYYDENGNWVEGGGGYDETGYDQQGYYDENGNWVEHAEGGY